MKQEIRIICLLIFFIVLACGQTAPPKSEKKEGNMREPAVAGQFYPGTKDSIDKMVTRFLRMQPFPKFPVE